MRGVTLAQPGEELRHVRRRHVLGPGHADAPEVLHPAPEVAAVGGEGVPRDPPFDVEVGQPGLRRPGHRRGPGRLRVRTAQESASARGMLAIPNASATAA
ncbi:hypothetical protein GCM10012283_02050 [Phycicoccus endophyticus]|nr:hypothetical protein GCM10012283_02050 [Phycicoccus endophyticus]